MPGKKRKRTTVLEHWQSFPHARRESTVKRIAAMPACRDWWTATEEEIRDVKIAATVLRFVGKARKVQAR